MTSDAPAAPLLLLLGLAVACTSTRGLAERAQSMQALPSIRGTSCSTAEIREESERWLALADLKQRQVYDVGAGARPRPLPRAGGARRLALRSFPGVPPDHPLAHRGFVYDQALALLWFTWLGDEEVARGLGATLVALQNADGTWGFSFDLEDGFYNAGYVRAGTVAWAAHALGTFAARFGDQAGAKAAARAAAALLRARRADGVPAAGLVEGGRGRWAPDERHFFPDYRLQAAITEHQLDAHMALVGAAPAAALHLQRQILDALWLDGEGRFAVAADNRGADPGRALDAAGGWGALWLHAQGDTARARRSLEYTVRSFPAEGTSPAGFRPYLDAIDGTESAQAKDLVFVEGTLGVGLAAHRLGQSRLAAEALQVAVRLACSRGPGVPYANRSARGFSTQPAAAPTLWFLFLEREIRTGEPAPLFPPTPPAYAPKPEDGP